MRFIHGVKRRGKGIPSVVIFMKRQERIMTKHEEMARSLFLEGYNCAQAVFLAFSDLTGYSREESLKLASSFGGGFGRLREVCGAVSGAEMALGALTGYTSLDDAEKKAHYTRVRELANRFKEKNGTYICRELLGPEADASSAVPTPRDTAFYQKRRCLEYVGTAAAILDGMLEELK